MRVISIITPRATWERVVRAIQGASLVVYMGHGNGDPGPNGTEEDTQNGFGLDPSSGVRSPVDYQGAETLRKRVRLARNAVVLLDHLCYASGNGEEYMGPEFRKSVAVPRVDNFAAGFLDIGARAVFAFGIDQEDQPAQGADAREPDHGSTSSRTAPARPSCVRRLRGSTRLLPRLQADRLGSPPHGPPPASGALSSA